MSALLSLGTMLALAGAAAPVGEANQPVSLAVQPAALELDGSQARHRLLVTALDAAGRTIDVTHLAQFTSRKSDIAAVAAGECLARGDGRTEIEVTFGGKSAKVPVVVRNAALERPPSFLNDVEPLLTRLGCNAGACHGKGAGQNGFRLSLRGYAPELDHQWLAREYQARRINPALPEDSLLLRKPLGLASHEGGKLLRKDSREYRLLLDWIGARMPGPGKDEPTAQKLEVLPGNRTLQPGQEQQLLVRAEIGAGVWRDVTWLTRFDSNDAGVVEVRPDGRLKVLRTGETAIRASFQGLVAVVIVTVPEARPVAPEKLAGRNNFIDDHVFKKLADLRIEPSDLCTDGEFLRRACLDTIGTLPTPEEVRTFLADRRSDKRARLVDSLLERPEFTDYWALQLCDLFQNRKERDHDVRGTKGVRAFHEWLRQQVQANRPWDELARAVLTATGSSTENPAVGYYVVTVGEKREGEKSEVVASVAQAFLGTRVGCAQCHNHPLEKYTQDDYYHFAGFFSRIKLDRKDPKMGPTTLTFGGRDPRQDKQPVGVVQPRTGKFLKPQPLDRSETAIETSEDPRVKLAAWMTDPKNEYFSGAMVNRLWRHYLGVGLVEPVDDLRASNPPTNPELWQALNREFTTHRFDLKHMMRLILNSRTYQLSPATSPANASDFRFYSHYYTRRLPAEVLLDACSQSTAVPENYPGYPLGIRAIQVPDPGLKNYFLGLFGKSDRVTACACERNDDVTMPQLLHLMNGDVIVRKLGAAEGRLAKLLAGTAANETIIDELFLATVSRTPRPDEVNKIQEYLANGGKRDELFKDLFWALLNTKEFAFNH